MSTLRVMALATLRAFWESHPSRHDAREAALAWYRRVLKADWRGPADVKADFRSASVLKGGRVVFNLAGNRYRIVVWINYTYRVVYVRFIGTHAEYDGIDAQTI
jgi:mRNA interferase HigB